MNLININSKDSMFDHPSSNSCQNGIGLDNSSNFTKDKFDRAISTNCVPNNSLQITPESYDEDSEVKKIVDDIINKEETSTNKISLNSTSVSTVTTSTTTPTAFTVPATHTTYATSSSSIFSTFFQP